MTTHAASVTQKCGTFGRVTLSGYPICLIALTTLVAAQSSKATPEAAVRALVTAIYKNDIAAYNTLTIPHPRRDVLTRGGRGNPDALRELQEYPQGLQIKRERDFLFEGRPAKPDASGKYPIGTNVLYMAAHRSGPMMVMLVQRPEGWRVDVRWWIAMADLMRGAESRQGTPEYAVRALTMALVSLDRKEAAKFVAPDANLDALFRGAPRYREPSGVLEASVMEMPLVRIEPGEFFPTPSGRIVEGSKADDVQVLVGQFGPTEITYVVRRVNGAWRVDVEPYFILLNR